MSSRRYCLTIQGVTPDISTFSTICTAVNEIKLAAWQHERGHTGGNDHIQLYVVLNKPVRATQVKTWFINNPHVEKAHGTHEQCVDYVTKADTRVEGPFFFPTESAVRDHCPGKRYDIVEAFNMVKEGKNELEIAETHPGVYARNIRAVQRYIFLKNSPRFREDIKCHVYYGAPGTGKSHSAWEDALALVGGDVTKVYAKSAGDWWDGYTGQDVVIFDDFYGSIRYSELLKVCDRYPLSVQIKGGFFAMCAHNFYFTSNTHPKDWYTNIKDKIDLNALKRRLTTVIYFTKENGQVQKIPEDLTSQTWTQDPLPFTNHTTTY